MTTDHERIVRCAFDEWYDRDSGWGPDRCSEYHLAKDAWNAAIDSALKCCNSKERVYDDIEMALLVSERIAALKRT